MRCLTILCLTLAVACGGGSDKTVAPQRGTLVVKLDAVTCTGTGTIEPFIDGTSQGQYTFSPGTSQSFPVDAGSHTVGARETPITQGSYVWPTTTVTVPANGSYTSVLGC